VATKKRSKRKTTRRKTRASSPVRLRLDPTNLLKLDHQRVKEMFAEIDELSERASAKARQLYAQIKQELQIHTRVEEEVVYPALERLRIKESRKLAFEAYEEHAVAKQLMQEIDRGGARDERFRAKLKVLKDIVLHHAQEEEREIFPKLKRGLNREARERLGAQIIGVKQQLLAREGKELRPALAS
jgi:iron-sulfur cluster repair protein YtfE (RIC family)